MKEKDSNLKKRNLENNKYNLKKYSQYFLNNINFII